MFQAAAGLGPDVENKIIVLERGSLSGSARHRLKYGNILSDYFLQIIRELREIFLAHHVVHDHVIFRTEDFEIFFGEIGNFQRAIGKGVVVWRLKSCGRGVVHSGGDTPATGNCDRKRCGPIFCADHIHPDRRAADECVALIVLRDVVLQRVGVNLVFDCDGFRAGEINAPGLAVRLAPGQFLAAGGVRAETLHVRGVVFDVVGAGRPIRDGEIHCGAGKRVHVHGDIEQMRVGAFELQFVTDRIGAGSGSTRRKC